MSARTFYGPIALAAFLLVFAVGGNLLFGPISPASARPNNQATDSVRLTIIVIGAGEGRVTSSPAGIDCSTGSTTGCIKNYPTPIDGGEKVTLIAQAQAGSRFAGWTGHCASPTTTCTVPDASAANHTVTATFNPPPPSITLSPDSGPPLTSTFTIRLSNFQTGRYNVIFGGRDIGSLTVTSMSGSTSRSFTVPSSGPGPREIIVGPARATFTVSSGLGITPTSGPVGTQVELNGDGFDVNRTNLQVRFGQQLLATPAVSGPEGTLKYSFTAPPLPAGAYSITVGAADPVTFTITSDLRLGDTAGPPGSTVTITGSGFQANTLLNLSFNGKAVHSVTVDGGGRISTSFQVPEAPGGPNSVGLGGKALSFSVTPLLTLSTASATPGRTVQISGSGFGRNERGISIALGGSQVQSGVAADAAGSWTSSFEVPPLAAGRHRVTAFGPSTKQNAAPAASLVLGSGLSLDKTSGPPGSTLKVRGSGFKPRETVRVAAGDNLVTTSVRADTKGVWSADLEVPSSPGGPLVISATGTGGQRTETQFSVTARVSLSNESAPPGSSITMTGVGFPSNAHDIAIRLGETVVASTSADRQGSFTRAFTVPQAPSDSYSVSISGPVPTLRVPFSVTPKITLKDSSGEAGGSVAVRGSGFGANESDITITLGDKPVVTGIVATGQGSWTVSFESPPLPAGVYSISASGAITSASDVPEVALNLASYLILSRSSGPPGEVIQVSGQGYSARDGVTITAGDGLVQTTTVADETGSWSANIRIPIAPGGRITIRASGSGGQSQETLYRVTPTASLSEAFGHPGGSVEIVGHGFEAGQSLSVSFGDTAAGSPVADSNGSWTATFAVPSAPSGSYLITVKSTGGELRIPFLISAGLTLSVTQAGPTEVISVSGAGFGATERGISVSVDRTAVASGISADRRGSWTVDFAVPALPGGTYEVWATGPVTDSGNTSQEFLTVIPRLDMSPDRGSPGARVNVTGRGFDSGQRDIVISFDNESVALVVAADNTGGFTTTFEVPESPSGLHFVSHSGSTAAQETGPGTGFQVTPNISLDQRGGPPGTIIQVSGQGFPANDPGITIAFDGIAQVNNVPANEIGSFIASVQAPASTGGIHEITAIGSGLAGLTNPLRDFEVTQVLALTTTTGNVGDELRITGLGFAPMATVTVDYGDGALHTEVLTNNLGTFELGLIIPVSQSGEHLIVAGDQEGFTAVATFVVEDTPPPLPVMLTPENETSGGLFGGFSPDLSWGPVEDPSGVTYDMQVSAAPDFSAPILEKTGLAVPSYTLTGEEALSRGKYYWRARAVDRAGNESAWTSPFEIKSGIIPTWLLPLLGFLLAAIAGGGGFTYYNQRKKALARGPVFPELAREVRSAPALPSAASTAGTAPTPRAQPRLALPSSPLRRRRQRSPEEQAQLRLVFDFLRSLPLLEVTSDLSWLDELVEAAGSTEPVTFERVLEGQIDLGYQPTWRRHPTFETVQQVLQGHTFLQELEAFVEAADGCAVDTVALLRQVYQDVDDGLPDDTAKVYRWRFVLGVLRHSLGWFRGSYLREPSARDYRTEAFTDDAEEPLVTLVGEPSTPFPGPLIEGVIEADALAYRDLHLALRGTYTTSEDARFLASRLASLEILRQQLTSSLEQLGDT